MFFLNLKKMKLNPKGEYMVFSIDDDVIECLTDGNPFKIYEYLNNFLKNYKQNQLLDKCFLQDMNTQAKSKIMPIWALLKFIKQGLGLVKNKKKVTRAIIKPKKK